MNKTFTSVAVVAIALVFVAPAAAQRLVPVGTRVQVHLREERHQANDRLGVRGNVLRGEVAAESAESLWVRPTPATGTLGIAKTGIRRLFESRGAPSRVRDLFGHGIAGAFAGALEGAVSYHAFGSDYASFGGNSRGEAAARAAMWTGAAFAVVGFAFPIEHWRRVRIR